MNRRDREVMHRLYRCAATAGDLYPSNPADIKRVAQAAKGATETMRAIGYILSSLSYADDYDIAVEEIGDLEQTLGIRAASPNKRKDSDG